MDASEFWQANSFVPFDADHSVWSARYQGTLEDFESFRTPIENFFRLHATRRQQSLVTITAVADGDGFIVFGITS